MSRLNPWAELGQSWPKNEVKADKLRQSRRSKEPEIIGFLLVDLVLLGPYLQSGSDRVADPVGVESFSSLQQFAQGLFHRFFAADCRQVEDPHVLRVGTLASVSRR